MDSKDVETFVFYKCAFVRSSRLFYSTLFLIFPQMCTTKGPPAWWTTSFALRRPSSLRSSSYCEPTNQTNKNPSRSKNDWNEITSFHIADPFLFFVLWTQWTPEFCFIKWPETARPQAAHPSAGGDVQCAVQGHGGDPANHWNRWHNLWPLGPSHHIWSSVTIVLMSSFPCLASISSIFGLKYDE